MTLTFEASKTQDLTCLANNIPLHSKYNPKSEAKKFVDSIEVDFSPKNIIITGPCLSYTKDFFKQRFPYSRLVAIQYSLDFTPYSDCWDVVFFVNKNENSLNFEEKLFNFLGEENIFATLFLSWKPSEKVFCEEYNFTWNCIKNVIEKNGSIVATRTYFNKTWFFNSLHFFKFIKKPVYFSSDKSFFFDLPIVITASGTSLKNQIKFLQENQKHFYILALSSSLSVLLENDILPDLVLSTDGGYYAKRHLKILETNEKFSNIPIIIPPEAKISSKLLECNPIIPLNYNDSFDSLFFTECRFCTLSGKRNGTVSGTAAELALNLTKNNIYFIGLDLASSKGFSHTQPNTLELDNSLIDNKLKSTETRITPSTFKNSSLEIYRNWFATRDINFYKRIFRITEKKDCLKQITNLSDVSNYEILTSENFISKSRTKNKITLSLQNQINISKEFLINYFKAEKELFLKNQCKNQLEWYKIASYTDYLQLLRAKDTDKSKYFDILKEKVSSLFDELFDYLA